MLIALPTVDEKTVYVNTNHIAVIFPWINPRNSSNGLRVILTASEEITGAEDWAPGSFCLYIDNHKNGALDRIIQATNTGKEYAEG
jgi:hypothetical protein